MEPVVRAPSVVAESGLVKVSSVTGVVLVGPSVFSEVRVVFWGSSGEEVVVGEASVLSELGAVV